MYRNYKRTKHIKIIIFQPSGIWEGFMLIWEPDLDICGQDKTKYSQSQCLTFTVICGEVLTKEWLASWNPEKETKRLNKNNNKYGRKAQIVTPFTYYPWWHMRKAGLIGISFKKSTNSLM